MRSYNAIIHRDHRSDEAKRKGKTGYAGNFEKKGL